MPVSTTSEAVAIIQFDLRRSARHKHELDGAGRPRTMLDNKYASLGEIHRAVLRRLAVFAGEFTQQAASAVIACTRIHRCDVAPGMVALQACSLLDMNSNGAVPRYQLSQQTRAFALGKLACNRELDMVARNHAEYLQCIFEYGEVELERGDPGQWMAQYGDLIEDVRSALDWAFSPSGDAAIGVGLTMAAIPLWLFSSRPDELCNRIQRALKSEALIGSGREMRLRIAARLAGMSNF
jgi:predicted ATPase